MKLQWKITVFLSCEKSNPDIEFWLLHSVSVFDIVWLLLHVKCLWPCENSSVWRWVGQIYLLNPIFSGTTEAEISFVKEHMANQSESTWMRLKEAVLNLGNRRWGYKCNNYHRFRQPSVHLWFALAIIQFA